MQKLMVWKAIASDPDGEKILHLKTDDGEFRPYWDFAFVAELEGRGGLRLAGLDSDLSDKLGSEVSAIQFSKGWHTYQSLLRDGWVLVKDEITQEIEESASTPEPAQPDIRLLIEGERVETDRRIREAIARHTHEAGWIGVIASAAISIWCLVLVCLFEFLAK